MIPTPSRRALPHQVHVMDAVIDVSCGEGTNTVRWMAHVAIAMYDRAGCKGYLQLGACQCDDKVRGGCFRFSGHPSRWREVTAARRFDPRWLCSVHA